MHFYNLYIFLVGYYNKLIKFLFFLYNKYIIEIIGHIYFNLILIVLFFNFTLYKFIIKLNYFQ
jgi:hypothetical protein